MPKGKKSRKISTHRHLIIKPSVVILGHSMPRRLRDYFDNELMSTADLNNIQNGGATYGQTYAKFLGLDNMYNEVHFIHCPTVFSPYFFQRVLAVGHLRPELVLVNISSNDLAEAEVNEQSVATALMGLMHFLCVQFNVRRVVFVSELKRCDVPNDNGIGRLHCSPDVFRTRVMNYNQIVLTECYINSSHMHGYLGSGRITMVTNPVG